MRSRLQVIYLGTEKKEVQGAAKKQGTSRECCWGQVESKHSLHTGPGSKSSHKIGTFIAGLEGKPIRLRRK